MLAERAASIAAADPASWTPAEAAAEAEYREELDLAVQSMWEDVFSRVGLLCDDNEVWEMVEPEFAADLDL